MPDELARSAALIERLLTDSGLRERFLRDPGGVLREHGLTELSERQRALLTLELRESRSSLAGATFAAAADAVAGAEAAAHAAPGWANAAAQEMSRLIHGAGSHRAGAHHAPGPTAPGRAAIPPLAARPGGPASPMPGPADTPSPAGSAAPTAPAGSPSATGGAGAPAADGPERADAAATGRAGAGIEQARAPAQDASASAAGHAGLHGPRADASAAAGDAAQLAHAPGPLRYPGDHAPPRALAHWMAAHARAAGLPAELPVMAALTESGLRNLSYGDRDSVGFFQMRTGIWDTGAYAGYPERPALQIQWFIDQALAVRRAHAGDPAFGRDPSSWGEWVADVEQPAAAYRGRYQTQLEAAQALLAGADASAGASAAMAAASPGAAALKVAEHFLGTPYDWGGSTPRTGFDCSGLVQYAYAQVGVHLPRVAADQFHVGIAVARDELRPGDAVFFADPNGYVHHVGLYIGDGRFIDAPETGQDVRIDSLSEPYFAAQYAGARRFMPAAGAHARTLPALGG